MDYSPQSEAPRQQHKSRLLIIAFGLFGVLLTTGIGIVAWKIIQF